MKGYSIWVFLLGLLLGGVASARLRGHSALKGTALLRDFSLAGVATGQTNWQVIEDRIYEPFPAQARSHGIARRIVARADLPDSEFSRFCMQFQQAVSAALTASGALNAGQFDLVQGATRVVNGSPVSFRIDLPRRYYSLGETRGVADIWYVAESGHVTVIASLIEGP